MKLLISLSLLVVLCVPSTILALDFTTGVKEAKKPEFKKLDEAKEPEFKVLDAVHGNIRDYFPRLEMLLVFRSKRMEVEGLSVIVRDFEPHRFTRATGLLYVEMENYMRSLYYELVNDLQEDASKKCKEKYSGKYETVYSGVSNLKYDVETSTTHITSVATADLFCAIPPSRKVVEINEPVETRNPVRVIPFPDINIDQYPYPPPRYRGDAPYPPR